MSTVVRSAVIGGVLALSALIAGPVHAAGKGAEAAKAPTMTVIGAQATQAVGVNSRGQVAVAAGVGSRSYIWEGGKVTQLPERFVPVAINEKGHVAGNIHYDDAPFYQAAIWRDNVLTPLSTRPFDLYASGMNDRDEVIGHEPFDDLGKVHAFVWRGGPVTELATPAGSESVATDINNKGEIVGFTSETVAGPRQAVIWRDGVRTALGAGVIYATGINERGEVAVDTYIDKRSRIGVWRNGRVRFVAAAESATTADINDRGDLAGTVDGGPQPSVAFRTSGTAVRDLGFGRGNAINNAGTVVGQYEPAEGGFFAAIWK
jgi:uncharacterized membrane protein